jgi:DNA repair exonuclease SbcCD nuclease subunit
MLRINHTADGHYRRDRADEFFSSLAVLAQYAQEADLNILAGDLFDYPVQNTGAAQFPDLAKTLKELSKKSPLVMVEGTESHDSDGCLNVFETISDKITVLRLGETYILNKRRGVIHTNPLDISAKREDVDDIALIFGIPEPRKKWLVASDRDVTLDQMMHTILAGYAAIRLRYPQLPCILVYHGHVLGSKMPNGESVDDGVRIDDLAMVGADYIALGDIHKPQRVGEKRGLNAYYAGSMFATKDWNEADIEFGFNRVYIDKGNVSVERIPYPHPVYRKIEKKAGEPISLSEIQLGAKIWVEIKATAQEALSIDRRALKDELISAGAHDESRVTIKPIPTETTTVHRDNA